LDSRRDWLGGEWRYDEVRFRYSMPVQEDCLVRSEVMSEEEDYALAEQLSSVRLRSQIQVPIREEEQHESHISSRYVDVVIRKS
jgi:hypothetical protein